MVARIAVPYDADGSVFQHFGKATEFKIYEIVDNAVEKSKVVGCDGGGHDLIGLWLVQQGVNAVICGGIGPGAQGALAAAGVAVFPGVEGSADDAIARLVDGSLSASSASNCHGHAGGCSGGGCKCHSSCGSCHR